MRCREVEAQNEEEIEEEMKQEIRGSKNQKKRLDWSIHFSPRVFC
jgi:hypothetical protein